MHENTLINKPVGLSKLWSTRLPALDLMLNGGLRQGCLYVIASRPSMGKTALAMSIATLMARSESVGFLSTEMTQKAIVERLIAMLGHIDLDLLQIANPAQNIEIDAKCLEKAYEQIEHLKLVTAAEPGLTVNTPATDLTTLQG
jgi:replicative DNA helicase